MGSWRPTRLFMLKISRRTVDVPAAEQDGHPESMYRMKMMQTSDPSNLPRESRLCRSPRCSIMLLGMKLERRALAILSHYPELLALIMMLAHAEVRQTTSARRGPRRRPVSVRTPTQAQTQRQCPDCGLLFSCHFRKCLLAHTTPHNKMILGGGEQ